MPSPAMTLCCGNEVKAITLLVICKPMTACTHVHRALERTIWARAEASCNGVLGTTEFQSAFPEGCEHQPRAVMTHGSSLQGRLLVHAWKGIYQVRLTMYESYMQRLKIIDQARLQLHAGNSAQAAYSACFWALLATGPISLLC